MNRKGRFAIVIMALLFGVNVDAQDFDKKNLLYRVSSVDNKTVELLGFEKKPKEELIVPDEVSYKGNKYTVSSIAENAFKDCAVLKKVVAITVQLIKESAFQGCVNLSTIEFANQLLEVERNAFKDCSSLSEVSLGDDIQTIGDAAFSNCTSLSILSLGSGLKSLGVGVINGSMINSITLPNSLTKVGCQAFANCNLLTSVTFGNALTEIENGAFEKTGIKSLSLPNSLVKIDENAFEGCDKLESVTFGNSLKEVGSNAFQGVAVSSISFPTSLQIIQNGAFSECKNLQNVSLNENIETIKTKAFAGCPLLSVDLTDCLADVADDAFEGCKSVITANYSLKGIAKYLETIKNNPPIIESVSEDRVNQLISDNKTILLNDFDCGFAFFNYMEKGEPKCDVITKYGKVISKNGGYIVSDGLIMVPSDDGKSLVLKNIKGKVLTQNDYDNIYKRYGQYLLYKRNGRYYPDAYKDEFLVVSRNTKFGFIDKTGKEIVPCKYDAVDVFKNGVARVSLGKDEVNYPNSKLVNKSGKEITPFTRLTEGAEWFESGYEVLYNNNKYGIIDKSGNAIIPFNYDYAYQVSDGLAAVAKDGHIGFVDKKNKVIIPFNYDFYGGDFYTFGFNEGLAAVVKNSNWGYIDKSNNIVIPFVYSAANKFNGGIAIVRNSDYYEGCINNTGKVVYPFNDMNDIIYIGEGVYGNITSREIILFNKSGVIGKFDTSCYLDGKVYYENFGGCFFISRNNRSGIIDKYGKEILPCNYDQIKLLEDRLIEAMDDHGKYIFSKSGTMIVSSEESMKSFAEGVILKGNGGKYGFTDESGQIITPCIYDDAKDFKHGYAIVCKGGSWGVIDRNGKDVIPCKYKKIHFFSDGIAVVENDEGWGFVDINGKSTFDYK